MTISGSSPLRIVGVHGVGYFNPGATAEGNSEAQSALWTLHLAAGLAMPSDSIDLDFAYYAHLLATGAVTQGASEDQLGDPLARELLAQWLQALEAPRPVTQGSLTLPLRHAASWVAKRYSLDGRLTRLFIRVFFREVAAYLRAGDDEARAAARDLVASRIAEHRPRVVVAHSLGTVVAYEALHSRPDLDVELLLTMGSPLALPHAVFDRLAPRPDGTPTPLGSRPSSVARWVNIADPGDPVAIPPGLANAFNGIALDLTTPVSEAFGFHRAGNYLAAAATSATLGPYIGA
ncbi:hypothetical protein ACFWV1_18790 [Streptomyces sp. NPDC058700]|uniref:hypothetical protein n=1 Tax=unclassified Streptomyces TaxID=2593676 RepID=UPI00366654B4